ncbi:hypothetical protein LIER_35462 [Lithospermum erythrorhizon]|uniref:Uncharacterized protein n=1 Tax=Lithospermum erythrorhizon TaxID=34254 RepID=A0AAV3NSJ5_LITER
MWTTHVPFSTVPRGLPLTFWLSSVLIFGLLMILFLVVTLLMVDFTAIMYLFWGPENRRNIFIVAASTCILVGFFAYLHVPSLANMIKSTFSNHALKENNHKRMLLLGRSEVVYR